MHAISELRKGSQKIVIRLINKYYSDLDLLIFIAIFVFNKVYKRTGLGLENSIFRDICRQTGICYERVRTIIPKRENRKRKM